MLDRNSVKVARLEGKDRPGLLAEATAICVGQNLLIRHSRGDVDLDRATVVMQLSGTPGDLDAAEAKMRKDLEKDGLIVRLFEQASMPVYSKDVYPYALEIEATSPATKGSEFLVELTAFLRKREINIVSYLQEVFTPALAAGEHALASLHILNIIVPLGVIVGREKFEADLRQLAIAKGCIDLRCGEPRSRR